jgi:polyhydroxyalkanoate synthesis regulator phasin
MDENATTTGQHWAITTREEVQHLERRLHDLAANAVAVEGRVNRLERDLRDVQDHYRERDRGARQFWLWALGLLVTLAITVVAGVVTLNGQIARLEERVDALRAQVQQAHSARWSQP